MLVLLPGRRERPDAIAEAVLGIRLDGSRHVGRKRPGGRRPDDQRLAPTLLEREADVQRRMLELLVVLLPGLLVRGERGAAARAPLRRAVALVEPATLVHGVKEPPDVLDVS